MAQSFVENGYEENEKRDGAVVIILTCLIVTAEKNGLYSHFYQNEKGKCWIGSKK